MLYRGTVLVISWIIDSQSDNANVRRRSGRVLPIYINGLFLRPKHISGKSGMQIFHYFVSSLILRTDKQTNKQPNKTTK